MSLTTKRKQIWVDPSFVDTFLKKHKQELKEITGGKKKKVSDVEATRYINQKYSFKL